MIREYSKYIINLINKVAKRPQQTAQRNLSRESSYAVRTFKQSIQILTDCLKAQRFNITIRFCYICCLEIDKAKSQAIQSQQNFVNFLEELLALPTGPLPPRQVLMKKHLEGVFIETV